MTQPPTITRSAITAGVSRLMADKYANRYLGSYGYAETVTQMVLAAAWPHLLQAIINDAYDGRHIAAGYAGDWLAHRYATILDALGES